MAIENNLNKNSKTLNELIDQLFPQIYKGEESCPYRTSIVNFGRRVRGLACQASRFTVPETVSWTHPSFIAVITTNSKALSIFNYFFFGKQTGFLGTFVEQSQELQSLGPLTSIQSPPWFHTLESTVVETTLLILSATFIMAAHRNKHEITSKIKLWAISRFWFRFI